MLISGPDNYHRQEGGAATMATSRNLAVALTWKGHHCPSTSTWLGWVEAAWADLGPRWVVKTIQEPVSQHPVGPTGLRTARW